LTFSSYCFKVTNFRLLYSPIFRKGYKWTSGPINFATEGLIIFYTRNTDENKGQVVGVYGKASVSKKATSKKVTFQKGAYLSNIVGDKDFSLLFPVPLEAKEYKTKSSDRMVGQNGFTYKDIKFAERILFDELTKLASVGSNDTDFKKLCDIYEFYIGKKFKYPFISIDEREQLEIEKFLKANKSKQDIIDELKELSVFDAKQVIVNHKAYKRDNKTIAQIKVLRDFKCQLCGISIFKKDGTLYIEAAHILPKYQKGRETPENIILLCPNHHKEFDYGLLTILIHDKEKVEFQLNEKYYKVKLSLE
jgi:hypothetical protein